jgi:hypothetical protein
LPQVETCVPIQKEKYVMMNNPFPKVVCAATLIIILCAVALSQTPETPESVAKNYFAAMQSGEWAKCAGLMHPEALVSMKRTFGSIVKADKSGEAAKALFGLKSAAEFEQLSDTAVFEKLMSFITGAVPDLKTALAASTSTILGQVAESPELAHIVYRTQIKVGAAEITQVELISFKKSGSSWRALLTADMEELFQKFAEGLSSPGDDKNDPPPPATAPKTRKP